MKIPEDKIEEIRSSADIVDIVAAQVRLKRRGKNYVGLCPFHQEKTPSFTVSPDKQMFYCFGCGEGGNVFTFVMKTEKVSFVEAVRSIGDRIGISIPQCGTEKTEGTYERLYQTVELAARFYHTSLLSTPEGEFALNYFKERGFTEETIKQFGLGYAPRGWDSLVKYANDRDFSNDELEKAGLAAKRDDPDSYRGYYDRLRGRALFPIYATTGRVVAFAGRQLYEDDTLAKYINTPETPIYQKGRLLYGLSVARDEIRREGSAILVEGYTDLISLYQAGIKNVVATSGTALTEGQITLIARYTPEIIIVYDADSAGSAATLRGVGLILEKGLDVRVAQLPKGSDPDSFIRMHGRDAFKEIVDKSISFLDFQSQILKSEGQFETPEKQAHAVRSIIETLAKIPDELKRNFYIKFIAEKYGLYESTLHRELENILNKERRRSVQPRRETTVNQIDSSHSHIEEPKTGSIVTIHPAERDILKLLFESQQDIIEFIFSQITPDEFKHQKAKSLYEILLQIYREKGNIDANALILSDDYDEYRGLIAHLLTDRYEISAHWEEIRGFEEETSHLQHCVDAVRMLKKRNIQNKIDLVRKEIKNAQDRGDDFLSHTRDLSFLQNQLKIIEQQYREVVKK